MGAPVEKPSKIPEKNFYNVFLSSGRYDLGFRRNSFVHFLLNISLRKWEASWATINNNSYASAVAFAETGYNELFTYRVTRQQ